ncbi:hypothetical protein [Actinocorallia aurantiaca]|uniref:50S ribosome-binding GTPase n=1 Tax=Actinocorallia aurantiaca TaxID=46204 RepID=A0ABP6H9L4_9ACTN
MTHRNEAGTPPHGEDPLGLDPRAPSRTDGASDIPPAPSLPEDDALTTGDPETPPPSPEDESFTSPVRRFPDASDEDSRTAGNGASASAFEEPALEDDPLSTGGLRLPAARRPAGDDPLRSGEFGGFSPEDDPLISGGLRRSVPGRFAGDDPLTSGEFDRRPGAAAGEEDPLTSPVFRARPEEELFKKGGLRGRPSRWGVRNEPPPSGESVNGFRQESFHQISQDDPFSAPASYDRGSAGDDQGMGGETGRSAEAGTDEDDPLTSGEFGRPGTSGMFDGDPLTSAEFGWRMAAEASGEDPLEGRRSRRPMVPEDDPLTSAEYRVPRSAELEARRAEAEAAASAERAGDAAGTAENAEDPSDGPGEAVVEAVEATEPAADEDASEDAEADERAEPKAELEVKAEPEVKAEAEAELEIAEVPEVPLAEPETPAEPEARAGDVAFAERLEALERLVELGDGRLDEELVAEASTLLERAGERMRLSGEYTVVALAGGTGSGKSSLFNAVCGLELSPSGMRRPMTSSAHACVWGHDGAGPLLDWLGIDKRFRYARAGTLGPKGEEGDSLEGLVLIDLPDHDSIQAVHRAEVDRFVGVADLLVWVVDPQKYADAALHRDYIVPFAQHASVTLIVLNQVDRLQPEEVDDCVSDLRRLLESEGLASPHIVTTSAVTEGGVDGLREVLARAVTAQSARADRLGADLDGLVERFAVLAEGGPVPVEIDEERAEGLVDALTVAAGVPAVAESMESAYELRAADYVGWPFARWAAALRRDPLRMIRLTELRDELRGAFTGPMGAQQGEVDNALHGITDGVTGDVPEPWRRSLRAAGRSNASELPEALGKALREVVPSFNQVPRWWWLVRIWQLLLVVLAVLGAVWVVLLVVYGVFGLADSPGGLLGDTGILPWVLLLVSCLVGMGALTAAACRNVVALSAARHGEKIVSTMRESLARVADEKVLTPVATELSVLEDFRAAVSDARR